ncbi:OLC1v1005517C1 [Oldenlandia corymbosa var. corymbosa]|uniref:Dirigent protein n=1 Tax=Oldenlandia corymbosa var. corymbosa TaxID=529605 RepID=A0AAV1DHH6_OLDCO|nr:OLC1v1005517C1 [Oldenlandia corymbosa var. corymbosa]
MAQKSSLSSSLSIKLCFTFMLAFLAFSATANPRPAHKEIKMTLYQQDISPGAPNATGIVVAGPTNLAFGSIVVVDDRVTERASNNSRQVGRIQGIYVTASRDSQSINVYYSLTFTTGAFNGSTLEIQGRSLKLGKVREFSITGGTGKFRFATGYATFETIFLDLTTNYNIARINLTVVCVCY